MRFFLNIEKYRLQQGLKDVQDIFRYYLSQNNDLLKSQFKKLLFDFQIIEEYEPEDLEASNFKYFDSDYCDDASPVVDLK